MNNLTKIAIILLGLIGVLLVGFQIWQEVNSYSKVTFKFDLKEGKATIRGNNTPEIEINNGQTLKLKHGNYRISTSGEGIDNSTQFIEINHKTNDVNVNFSYNKERLMSILDSERSDIENAIYNQYPNINDLYSIYNQAVYNQGEYYGATLNFRDQTSDQRDTLHILAKKENRKWRVLSLPPSPVLSAPKYPNVPKEILRKINLDE